MKNPTYTLHPVRAAESFAELQRMFYDGWSFYVYEYGQPKLTNINEIPDGACVRIVYAKDLDDFNFGDNISSIDREYSISFVVNKQQEEIFN